MKLGSIVLVLCGSLTACEIPPLRPDPLIDALLDAPGEPAPEPVTSQVQEKSVGTEIVVAGKRYDIGTPVVLWSQEPRYNAYSKVPRFSAEGKRGLRYQSGRTARDAALAADVRREGWSLANLQQQVDQFVLHYDVCGNSKTCFKVLQDLRGFSVHFLLDVDGTIYQTLDLKEQAWHASQANPRSIGVEIAHIGAYPLGKPSPLDEWYPLEAGERRLRLPARLGDGALRVAGFRGRPARQEAIVGRIQGGKLQQFDYTQEQYDALVHLSAGLVRIFPRIRVDAPRDRKGALRSSVLSAAELQAYRGLLGHYHVSGIKIDPGPALDWEALLRRVRELLMRP